MVLRIGAAVGEVDDESRGAKDLRRFGKSIGRRCSTSVAATGERFEPSRGANDLCGSGRGKCTKAVVPAWPYMTLGYSLVCPVFSSLS